MTDIYVYSYDPAGHLSDVTRNGSLISHYEYDLNGNRLSQAMSGSTVSYTYDDQDRLLQAAGPSPQLSADYTYTANGELLTKTVGTDPKATLDLLPARILLAGLGIVTFVPPTVSEIAAQSVRLWQAALLLFARGTPGPQSLSSGTWLRFGRQNGWSTPRHPLPDPSKYSTTRDAIRTEWPSPTIASSTWKMRRCVSAGRIIAITIGRKPCPQGRRVHPAFFAPCPAKRIPTHRVLWLPR